MGVDDWDEAIWENEFNTFNVLVMTAQILLNLLSHSYITLSKVNLLIFDECHHAKKKGPYRQIMQCFSDCPQHPLPKVMGLTASIVNGKVKPYKLESEIQNNAKQVKMKMLKNMLLNPKNLSLFTQARALMKTRTY